MIQKPLKNGRDAFAIGVDYGTNQRCHLTTDEMKRYCFALDLRDDKELIQEYDEWHTKVSPEIKKSIIDAGIIRMDMYRAGNRMFMIVEAEDHFSLEEKAKRDAENPTVQKWEDLMWQYQQPLPFAKPGEKWMLMKQIFELQ